ncbi:MAG: hypothetical protein C0518_15045 [Opitutus sp.]|nr:hypothetical protein [Opitutus sp.]
MHHDLRFAARTLAKSPGFTLLAIAMVALGVSASTACFSFLNAFFLQTPPFARPHEIVSLHTVDEKNPGLMALSTPNFEDYRRDNTVFTGMALHLSLGARLTEGEKNSYLFGQMVSANYFELLGVPAALGRALNRADDAENAAAVVVVSDNFWQTRLGGAADVLGRTLLLEGEPFVIVGVMPRGFKGVNFFEPPDFWAPTSVHRTLLKGQALDFYQSRRAVSVPVFARLKPGVTRAQAQQALQPIAAELAKAFPADNAGRSVSLLPITQSIINPNFRADLVKAGNLLLSLAGLILLIACANLANLLLARAGGRQREIALRVALGASRAQVVRQLLTEHFLLAALGGGAGIVLAGWIRDLLWALRPQGFPTTVNIALDARVIAFGLGATLLTGLLFGLLPALSAARVDLMAVLKRDRQGGSPLFSFRHMLVVAQVALSVVALVVAGLFVRSLQRANTVDLGWDPRNLALLSANLVGRGYDQTRSLEFYRRAIEQLKSVPGVLDVSVSSRQFLTGVNPQRTIRPQGSDDSLRTRGKLMSYACVLPGYLRFMNIGFIAGRDFTADDDLQHPLVLIVNETFARQMWPGEDPLGKTVKLHGSESLLQVVGVVRDIRDTEMRADPAPFAYFPLQQTFHGNNVFHIRTATDANALVTTLRQELQSLDPAVDIFGARSVDESIRRAMWGPRTGAALMSGFGLIALFLASLGIYAVMSQAVQQRTREIGIRLAIGAQAHAVLRLILQRGALVAGAGLLAGLGVALACTSYLRTFLFEIEPTDPLTFAAIAVILSAVALFACYVPARRATKVDPLVALRAE